MLALSNAVEVLQKNDVDISDDINVTDDELSEYDEYDEDENKDNVNGSKIIRRRTRPWAPEEDELVMKLVKQYGGPKDGEQVTQ